jgi:hypothetical protein
MFKQKSNMLSGNLIDNSPMKKKVKEQIIVARPLKFQEYNSLSKKRERLHGT